MRCSSTGSLFAVLGLGCALVLGGCAKHDDTSSASSTTDSTTASAAPADASAAAASVASPAPDASATDTSITVHRADGTAITMNGGSHVGAIDVPMYPSLTAKSGSPIDITADGTHTQMGTYTSDDDFATIDAWYKAHLSSDFKEEHMSMNDMQESSYHEGDDNTLPTRAIAITSAKDSSTGKMVTTVTAVVKEKT